MAGSSNGTQQSADGLFDGSVGLWVLLAVISSMLVLSLCWNIVWCVAKFCADRGLTLLPKIRKSMSLREMEENPIYGNINYTQARIDPLDSPCSSSSLRDQQGAQRDSQSQSNNQDCYANLTLKAPKPQSGRSSPKIQYSDIVEFVESPQKDKEAAGNPDTVSTLSDLYASVQTQRTKTLDTSDSGDGYANHISETP